MNGHVGSDYSKVVAELRKNFSNGILSGINARLDILRQISKMLIDCEDQIYEALYKDLKKPKVEAFFSEVLVLQNELKSCSQNLHSWMKPERLTNDIFNKLNTCEIRKDPLGVVLVIGPWNYPVNTIFLPVISAIAAGNCVVIKPSELTANTASLLERMISTYLDSNCIRLINGGIPETTALLQQRFDHIFFTGGTAVGRIVMAAAAKYLTPVTLELGGKCPAVVDDSCDFDVVGQRIAWAKYVNNGQTCIAVDYILYVGECHEKLTTAIKGAIEKFYGDDAKKSDSYGRIINDRHFQRVANMIDKAKVFYGGQTDKDNLYISPTIMENVTADDLCMQQEIFGPVLPIIDVSSIEEAIQFINKREKPLAVYVFSNNYAVAETITKQTSSGAVCINDAIIQAGISNLPFGGVGESGMGACHGKAGFDTFTHRKSYLYKSQKLEGINSLRYPPYDENWSVLGWIKWLITPKF